MGDIDGKYPCDDCGQKFWLKTELETHTIHAVRCHLCSISFSSEINLEIHKTEVHEVLQILVTPDVEEAM